MKLRRAILVILIVTAQLSQLVWAVSPELQSVNVRLDANELMPMCHEQAGGMDISASSTSSESCCTPACPCPMAAGAVYGLGATSLLSTSLYQHTSSKIDLYLDGVVLHSISPLFRPPISA